jgi:uncharacterized protein
LQGSDESLDRIKAEEWSHVAALLEDHRDQLLGDHELLHRLGLRHRAVTLLEFGPAALSKLEDRALKDFDARRRLESTMNANFDAQCQTHEMALSLMESRHLSDLALRLNAQSVIRFSMVKAVLAIEDTGPVPLGWRSLDEGGVDYLLGEGADALLGPDGVCRILFGDEVRQIRSAALLRLKLWRDQRPAVLAFGSEDETGFEPAMGMELIGFIAKVVERMATRWPPIPPRA